MPEEQEQVIDQIAPQIYAAPASPVEAGQAAPEAESTEQDEPETVPGKGGFQKRISKLTSRFRTAEREAEYWKFKAIKAGVSSDEGPNELDDPESRTNYNKAARQRLLDEELVNKGLAPLSDSLPAKEWMRRRNAQIKSGRDPILSVDEFVGTGAEEGGGIEGTEASGQQEPTDQQPLPPDHPHRERAQAAATWYPDWREVGEAAKNIPIAPRLVEAVANLDNSADVAYAFAKNPELLAALHQIPEQRAVAELTKISNLIAGRPEDDSEERPAARVQPAPAPLKPLKKSSPTATGLSDDLPWGEWVKRRNAQIAAQRR